MKREIIDCILAEQRSSTANHGPWPQNLERQANLATEELGEMVREINDFTRAHGSKDQLQRGRQGRSSRFKIAHEAIQLASTAFSIINFLMEDTQCRQELYEWCKAVNTEAKAREPYPPQ
jgi:NTP pyrophosphatase (non-canonical NTP hydrolase)